MTLLRKTRFGLISLLSLLLASHAVAASPASRQVLPTEFVHGRIFVTPRLASGQTLRFYTDSGGGLNMVQRGVAERLRLAPSAAVEGDGGVSFQTVTWPVFAGDASIPVPKADPFLQGRLASIAPGELGDDRLADEGFLGNRWFGGRVWEFDYPAKALASLEHWQAPKDMAATPMTMRSDRQMYWPRIEIEVDGQTLPMLFDTGAQATLGIDAARFYGLREGAVVAGSFITATHFNQWRQKHPQWQVAEHGDTGLGESLPMIEVPDVRIAGVSTGPVWFAMRRDESFTEYMSSMTDAPVEGAIGGSAFTQLRLVADYPAKMLYVASPQKTP